MGALLVIGRAKETRVVPETVAISKELHNFIRVIDRCTTSPRSVRRIRPSPQTSTLPTMSTSPSPASTASLAPRTAIQLLGLMLLHGGVAGWIGYGAFIKATEFNPNLLPGVILDVLRFVMTRSAVDPSVFMSWSLRSIIGVEIFLALAILLSARYARVLAITTLGFFCAILLYAMITTAMSDGIVKAVTTGCGCFGSAGMPASVMFLVDATLLASAFFLVSRQREGTATPVAATLAIGMIAIFAIREPEMTTTTTPTEVVKDPNTNASGGSDATNPELVTKPAVITGPWPSAPAKYEKTYFPRWKDWIGQPLRDQKLARAIEGTMPADLERGDWLVVFSRPDCEDCQSMFRGNFAVARKERVLKVTVPDSRGPHIGMPCIGCEERMLYRVRAGETSKGKSPDYVFQTPVIVRMKDGIVSGVCVDRSNAAEYASVFGEPVKSTAAAPTDPATPVVTPPTTATTAAWPGPPAKLSSFYVAEFSGTVGKPLADLPFALLIENKLPPKFLEGRWIVVFYREDCDHCNDLLMTYFSGALKFPTLTVAIPDADPAASMPNPCDACSKLSMIKGPNYVIGTPVVLAINNGIIECVVEDVEDMTALEACLKFNTP